MLTRWWRILFRTGKGGGAGVLIVACAFFVRQFISHPYKGDLARGGGGIEAHY